MGGSTGELDQAHNHARICAYGLCLGQGRTRKALPRRHQSVVVGNVQCALDCGRLGVALCLFILWTFCTSVQTKMFTAYLSFRVAFWRQIVCSQNAFLWARTFSWLRSLQWPKLADISLAALGRLGAPQSYTKVIAVFE